ncbi:MAG: HAMP domain-containing histidine kinase [Lachnospiraceae bacterium]|nr:HAMP domain-containing histidine kinase [Lachnospiraceae bacterium]
MYKQLRKRFIAASMAGMLLVTLIVVGAINIINFVNEKKSINEMLEFINNFSMDMSGKDGKQDRDKGFRPEEMPGELPGEMPADLPEDMKNNRGDGENDDFRRWNRDDLKRGFDRINFTAETQYTTRFFIVEFDSDGTIVRTDTTSIAAIDNDEAQKIAARLYKGKQQSGRDGYYYYKEYETENGSCLVYLDCTNEILQSRKLLLISLGVALASLVMEFILLWFFSKKVVKPVAESVEKQKSFITDASHELKTPLTIISANTEVLEMMDEKNEWTESIKNQTVRLSKLINEMVYLAKMDEEKRELTMENFSLSNAVNEVVMPFETVAKSKGFSFDTEIEDNIDFHGDEAAVRQMVSIFMDNAMKYTGKNEAGEEKIKVSLQRKNKKARLTVYNTCEKIDKETLSRLFERFYRVDKSRSRETGGSGIGLSIVQAIADKHKGLNVRADSKAEGTIEFIADFEIKK